MPPRAIRRDEGQALPLMAVALVVAAVMALVVTTTARGADLRARARTAADAAALAGAAAGEVAAADMATANGGVLVDYRRVGDQVRVEVRVGEARAVAVARAERTWSARGRPAARFGRGAAPGGGSSRRMSPCGRRR